MTIFDRRLAGFVAGAMLLAPSASRWNAFRSAIRRPSYRPAGAHRVVVIDGGGKSPRVEAFLGKILQH